MFFPAELGNIWRKQTELDEQRKHPLDSGALFLEPAVSYPGRWLEE